MNKDSIRLPLPTPLEEARSYCYRMDWHDKGKTRAMLFNGTLVDLPEAMVAFCEQVLKERDRWRELAMGMINTKLPDPVIVKLEKE